LEPLTKNTALESFINHKNSTGMQCGSYTIDLPKLKENQQYRFVFDATACIGCHCCEVACNEQNNNPDNIKWRRVGEMEVGEFPDTLQLFNSMSCNHCLEPECLKGCPTNAYIKLENGVVFHDDPNCIGCQYCTWNCPYEVPVFNKDRGIVTKCHMCVDKLEVGQTPACVQACPANAINIEVFDVDKWLAEDLKKQGVAPHLPDIDITKPTTRYILPDIIEGEIKVANEHILKPAHPEWPLIFMTILTQASLGAFVAIFLGQLLYSLGFNLPKPTTAMSFFALALIGIGLPLSALHLGRPSKAIWAMRNYKTSWLSREAIALGGYAAVAFLVWMTYLFNFNGFLKFYSLFYGKVPGCLFLKIYG
jgi:Fe-S-cluster-containing dehydrogenase component